MTTIEMLEGMRAMWENMQSWDIEGDEDWNEWVAALRQNIIAFTESAECHENWQDAFAELSEEQRYLVTEAARLSELEGAREIYQLLLAETILLKMWPVDGSI